jgi:hypothetical protein
MSIVSPPDPECRGTESDSTITFPRPYGFCYRHWSWLCGRGQGKCSAEFRAAAQFLELRAEQEATGSRDFGRGYMHAVRLLRGQ